MDIMLPDAELNAETAHVAPEQIEADATLHTVSDENAEVSEKQNTSGELPSSKEAVIDALAALSLKEPADVSRDEVARLKQQYYNIRHANTERLRKEFTEAGNNPDDFKTPDDTTEERLKELLATIREKKAELTRAVEHQREENLKKKKEIIAAIVQLSADTDNVNKLFPEFRELQQQFKAAGEIPQPSITETWKAYQEAVERFYDQLKVNKDLRDYDFKKNLEAKDIICRQAEELDKEKDVVMAFRRLQELHDKWREIGPVDKEMREQIWVRFRDASTVIHKKYQAYFEERKQREQENEEAKTAICEELEKINPAKYKSYSAWENATKKVLEIQEKWKTLGFASRKNNSALYERYRAACDRFFNLKSDFYNEYRAMLADNLAKKTDLCLRAEALSDSTDWKATTERIIELQKEWRTIGTVSKRYSDAIWKRFTDACETFFEKRKQANADTRNAEVANLKAKKEIIAALRAITDETPREDAIATVKDAIARWGKIGHVPFREKNKIYETYRHLVDALYEKFDIRETRAGMARFESNISAIKGDSNKMYRERERFVRAYEMKTAELATAENNLGFFTSKSKSGDSMMRDMERRIQRIKEDLATLEEKIKVIDANM